MKRSSFLTIVATSTLLTVIAISLFYCTDRFSTESGTNRYDKFISSREVIADEKHEQQILAIVRLGRELENRNQEIIHHLANAGRSLGWLLICISCVQISTIFSAFRQVNRVKP